jgi:predicted MFS family arabinose efflux permease
MALGSFVSGWVVDTYGPTNGFWVSVGAAILAFITVLFGQKILADSRLRTTAEPSLQAAE